MPLNMQRNLQNDHDKEIIGMISVNETFDTEF